MIIRNAELTAVAVREDQYPPADLPEIAFAGRSNVGKSTLLNLLTNRKKLARVSGSPGKTRTINFYEITAKSPEMDSIPGEAGQDSLRLRIVDLPGYGYAKLSKSQTQKWGKMMEQYLSARPNLVRVVQLIDSRHDPTALDVQMYEFLKYYGLDGLVAATKSDKISRSEKPKKESAIRRKLSMKPEDRVIFLSALKRTGHEELGNELERIAISWKPGTAQELPE